MRYTESDLILPTLEVLVKSKSGVSTSQLIDILTKELQPSGKDAEILAKRKDTRFSQKVRNLKSHDTLTRKDLATYSGGVFKITPKGKEYLEHGYQGIVRSLQDQGFSEEEREKEFKEDYKNLIIEEGVLITKDIKLRKRSGRLTKLAKKHYAKRGRISCEVCGFDFHKTYGELGQGYIEIHHKHPMHSHDISGEKIKIITALKAVAPLCSNCHRMIHRNRGIIVKISELKKIVKKINQA
jgi:predicted HNH restriction endonuclease